MKNKKPSVIIKIANYFNLKKIIILIINVNTKSAIPIRVRFNSLYVVVMIKINTIKVQKMHAIGVIID
ncbi:hypothetical protein D5071_00655 [Pectobacterium carotovorum]|uniref:Uncharacterized protein n=1 Tax=Pectobacterium carotovorum TaxID=554 RepID=A0A419B202_PECCA|nr:hypothetical protein D5071_00655 [Pectobacterium carotovorum]